MASKTYRPGQEAQLAHDLKAYPRRMMVEFHRAMHAEAGVRLVALTPEVTGDMRGRWGDRIDGQENIPAGARAGLAQIRLGSRSARVNDDPGAEVIDRGRKRYTYGLGSGARHRIAGSEQAPEGMVEPGRRYMLGYAQVAAAKAIAEAERRFGR